MNPEQLSATVVEVLSALVEDGLLDLPDGAPREVTIERPRQKGHGDYATNVALRLAKPAGSQPARRRRAARRAAARADGHRAGRRRRARLPQHDARARARSAQVARRGRRRRCGVRPRRPCWPGSGSTWSSSRPTPPGRCTWATPGGPPSATPSPRVLEAAGAEVTREYYINDRGVQMTASRDSLVAAALGEPVPEDGYAGAYIADLAAGGRWPPSPGILELPEDERRVAGVPRRGVRAAARATSRTPSRGSASHFDVWFSERSLHESGRSTEALDRLREQGHVYEADGARLAAHHRLRRRQGPRARSSPTAS